MRLSLQEGWAGRGRRVALCPNCSSERARYSRRAYDGPWFRVFRVRPVKCSDCGAYFAIAAAGSIRRPETDPIDLHIPFRPSELDAPAVGFGEPAFEDSASDPPRIRPGRRACPVCGSEDIRPSRPGIEPPTSRFDVTTAYRCVRCNASFKRTSLLRLLGFSLLLLGVLAGLSYLALATLGVRGITNRSPRIQQDQIKEPPPPVFR